MIFIDIFFHFFYINLSDLFPDFYVVSGLTLIFYLQGFFGALFAQNTNDTINRTICHDTVTIIKYDTVIVKKDPVRIVKKVYIPWKRGKSGFKFLSLQAGAGLYSKHWAVRQANYNNRPVSSLFLSMESGFFTNSFQYTLGIGFKEMNSKVTLNSRIINDVTAVQYYTVDSVKSGQTLLPDTSIFNYSYDTIWHTRYDTSYTQKKYSTQLKSKYVRIPVYIGFPIYIKKLILIPTVGAILDVNVSNHLSHNQGGVFEKALHEKKLIVSPRFLLKGIYPVSRCWYFSTAIALAYVNDPGKQSFLMPTIQGGIAYLFAKLTDRNPYSSFHK